MKYDTTGPVAMGFGMLSRFCQVWLREDGNSGKDCEMWGVECNE